MAGITPSLSIVGYALAGTVFFVLTVLLLINWQGRLQGRLLAFSAAMSSVWGFTLAWGHLTPENLSDFQLLLIEMCHDGAWLVFLSTVMSGPVGNRRAWVMRYGGVFLIAGLLVAGIGPELVSGPDWTVDLTSEVLRLGSILTAFFALVVIEQIYRNARESQRRGLKYLCIGVGGIFAYDLFLYSDAILFGKISPLFWGVRGYVVSLCIPLIAVAAHRSPTWSAGIFVSRQIVFYSATLFGVGIYLIFIGFSSYSFRIIGGQWGPAIQVIFISAAIIGLFIFLVSDRHRALLRIFITKHFFENKYEYREEWLRLIHTLTTPEDELPLKKRGIKSLAQIIEAPSGLLWLKSSDNDEYLCAASWNVPRSRSAVNGQQSLIKFLEQTGWIIDLREYETKSSHYESLNLDDVSFELENAAFIIPLLHDGDLFGFVVLSHPKTFISLNFEDYDLLKTVGQQVAGYLAQAQSTERLAEGRQFEAYNRLTAYIMHDLKNLIAQQSLVVENAKRHKNNPEFIEDAVTTIEGGVTRMRRVIEQLQQRSVAQRLERVELGKLIMQAVSQCADRQPVPRALIGEDQIWVRADRERLLMALCHAIRNAQHATRPDGGVKVMLKANGSDCSVCIIDTGIGMDEVFVRERLFKPFDSTKGNQGMGMGAYQVRETVRALGGEVLVESRPDQGTSIVLKLLQAH